MKLAFNLLKNYNFGSNTNEGFKQSLKKTVLTVLIQKNTFLPKFLLRFLFYSIAKLKSNSYCIYELTVKF